MAELPQEGEFSPSVTLLITFTSTPPSLLIPIPCPHQLPCQRGVWATRAGDLPGLTLLTFSRLASRS